MRITTHGDYLTQLTLYPKLFPVNFYLVREDDGLTVIDAGLPGSAPTILAAASKMGLTITRIALTHAHGDHIGSLDSLNELLPDVEIAISAREARLLAGDYSLDPTEPQSKVRGQFVKIKTVPTRLLLPGDRIGSLEVVAAPGHTPGHIAYFDTRDQTLIAGDSWQVAGGLAVAGTLRPLFPWPAMATWDRPTALNSARRLASLTPSRLAVGHGEVIEQPTLQMLAAMKNASNNLPGVTNHAL